MDGALVEGDVAIADGRVARVGLESVAAGGLAVPGFVDLQVNGFAGVDFLSADGDGYEQAGEALAATGVTAYLPTFISSPIGCLPGGTGHGGRAVRLDERGGAGRACSVCTSRDRSCRPAGRAPTTPPTCSSPTRRWPIACATPARCG